MLFPTLPFLLFFAIVLLGHRSLPRQARPGWLLAASLFFYFLWIPAYLLLLIADIGINYLLLRLMIAQRTRGQQKSRFWLVVSVMFTLCLLAGFKYAAFLVGIIAPFSTILVGPELPLPDLLLPLGISFYSFQLIALHVDVYRGTTDPPRNLAQYALFVCFFPQLIAGPILRGRELLPQIATGGSPNRDRNRRGLWLVGSGLIKKVVLGDFLLAPLVNEVYGNPGVSSAPMHLIAAYYFSFQIYFDFSGYTDMARGIGLLLGFEFPKNFREPYLSRNPSEFWERWHITLSQWLRDYLYIPLGGSRGRAARTSRNLLITMLLGGLWHGAGWNFLIWGGLHGLLLMLHRPFRRHEHRPRPLGAKDIGSILLCFHAVTFLWIFFRSPNPESALTFIQALLAGNWSVAPPLWPLLVLTVCILCQIAERLVRKRLASLQQHLSSSPGIVVEGIVLGSVFMLAIACSGRGGDFIYFQF